MYKIFIFYLIFITNLSFSQSNCWKEISSIGSHTLALKIDGTLWAWGFNSEGQLGNNTLISSTLPIQIGTENDWKQISAGTGISAAIKNNGTLWVWGSNFNGLLGIPTSSNSKIPNQLGTSIWKQVSAGDYYFSAIKEESTFSNYGSLWQWGGNANALGSSSYLINPTKIGTRTDWRSVVSGYSFTFAIGTFNTIWGWGLNSYGQLGNGNQINQNTPVQIGGNTTWKKIDPGYYHTIAIRNDNTLWTWGRNHFGQLGNGTNTDSSIPIQVDNSNDWLNISAGGNFCLVTKNNGNLYSFGYNSDGQLGIGSNSNSNLPIQIGNSSNWDKINGSDRYAYSIDNLNNLWQWGNNSSNIPSTISCTTLSNYEFVKESFLVYPNPVNNFLYIENIKDSNYEIYDISSKRVLYGIINNPINVSSLEKGVYFLKVTFEDKVTTQKFIKE